LGLFLELSTKLEPQKVKALVEREALVRAFNLGSMASLHSLSKLTQAYRLEMKRHCTYVTTMTKELSSRKETSILYCND
jgi:hypothetical protein